MACPSALFMKSCLAFLQYLERLKVRRGGGIIIYTGYCGTGRCKEWGMASRGKKGFQSRSIIRLGPPIRYPYYLQCCF